MSCLPPGQAGPNMRISHARGCPTAYYDSFQVRRPCARPRQRQRSLPSRWEVEAAAFQKKGSTRRQINDECSPRAR